MKDLSVQEIKMVSGGNEEGDDAFHGLVFGMALGSMAGAVFGMHYVSKSRLLSVIPGFLESTTMLCAAGGAIVGGVLGVCIAD